jgi:hypothetical protein
MKKNLEPQQHSTSIQQQSKLYVTMIHPHHPCYDQRLLVIGRRAGIDPLIYVRLPDGTKSTVRPEWVVDSTDCDQPERPPSHLLELEGLRAVARLIEQMRKEGRFPKRI